MWVVRVGRGGHVAVAPVMPRALRNLLRRRSTCRVPPRQGYHAAVVLQRWQCNPHISSASCRAASTTAGDAGASESAESAKEDGKAKKDKDKPMSWGAFWLYFSGGVSGIVFLWHFYKAGYNLHRTEISLLESFRKLPFYWPPGPPEAYRNSELNPEGLHPELVAVFTEWFLASDIQVPEGVTRDDVLELVRELGFSEEERPCKDFLYRGEGELEERKRLSGAGLQETLALLAQLSRLPAPPPPKPREVEEGETPPPPEPPGRTGAERLGPDGIALFKRKLKGFGSVMGGASALHQAMQPLASGAPAATGSAAKLQERFPAANMGLGAASRRSEEDDETPSGVDEAQQLQIEAARLERQEKELVARLERLGSLSPAEEARLNDIRTRKAAVLRPS